MRMKQPWCACAQGCIHLFIYSFIHFVAGVPTLDTLCHCGHKQYTVLAIFMTYSVQYCVPSAHNVLYTVSQPQTCHAFPWRSVVTRLPALPWEIANVAPFCIRLISNLEHSIQLYTYCRQLIGNIWWAQCRFVFQVHYTGTLKHVCTSPILENCLQDAES